MCHELYSLTSRLLHSKQQQQVQQPSAPIHIQSIQSLHSPSLSLLLSLLLSVFPQHQHPPTAQPASKIKKKKSPVIKYFFSTLFFSFLHPLHPRQPKHHQHSDDLHNDVSNSSSFGCACPLWRPPVTSFPYSLVVCCDDPIQSPTPCRRLCLVRAQKRQKESHHNLPHGQFRQLLSQARPTPRSLDYYHC